MDAIQVQEITKRYENHVAVDGISFAVPRGSVYGLLGPNGAGKTTTIRMILNILRPDQGSIRILGREMSQKIIDRIGYLPEERGMYGKMKVVDHLLFLAEIKGLVRRDALPRVDSWISRFALSEWRDKKVSELSKGMQQKLQFIATVIHKPEVLILDEPFSGLDPVNTNLLKDVILELNRDGTTVIFSTHIMEQVEKLCAAICLINRGQIVVEGNLSQVKQRCWTNTVVLGFDGDGGFLSGVDGVEKVDMHPNYAEIRMRDGADPSGLLSAAMGRLKVKRFEVVEPTLNSIFIDLVGVPVDQASEEQQVAPAADAASVPGGAHV